jgi:UDP-N-acetylmuramate dehydrogenase
MDAEPDMQTLLASAPCEVRTGVPIDTWFGVGGAADLYAEPKSTDELAALLAWARAQQIRPLRILGDGANLLVADDGVDGLVVSLNALTDVDWPETDTANPRQTFVVRAQGGARLMEMVTESVRRGLTGLESLAGIPATIGGAVAMNAGGAFGQIADSVRTVHAIKPDGTRLALTRDEIGFEYRKGLRGAVVAEVELELHFAPDQFSLRERLKEIMAYKKGSQPMAEHSAGCAFKNPVMRDPNTGEMERVSAGKLIDKAGLKTFSIGGAAVSQVHANFLVVDKAKATAADVLNLIDAIQQRVAEKDGVSLEPEIVVWRRGDTNGSVA